MQSITVKIAYWFATFFGAGRAAKAPGTVGSLMALPVAYFLWQLPVAWAWVVVVVFFLLGVAAAEVVIKDSGVEDPGFVVIDEVVGIFISSCLCGRSVAGFAAAFVLFRIFDIWKPFPVSYADQNIKGGFGAMLDDAVAGGMALLVYYLIAKFWPGFSF